MGSSSMTTSAPIGFFVCFVISVATFHICFCNGISSSFNPTHNNITCFENEREALVKFKQDLKDPSNRLSSWDTVGDCCRWAGVVCDNLTGHVQEIRLQPNEYQDYLGGKVSPSLLDLKHLQYLDLSNNNFEGAPIPSFIGSIATLRYLNLSWAEFGGTIPSQLGNITTIRYLDLGNNIGVRVGNLQWLAGLVSLQHLDMSSVDLSKALDWLRVTSNLPSLVELHLSGCQLKYVVSPSSTSKINFTSLHILDLSGNHLGPSIPGWIHSLNNLVSLDLSGCSFSGPVTCGLQNMTSLKVLDLHFNSFNSRIPNCLYSLSHLQSLSLGDNLLHGVISIAIENLTSLVSLDLEFNQLHGSMPTSLGKLCKMKTIDLAFNELSGEVANILIGFSRCKSHMLEVFSLECNLFLGQLPDELGQLENLYVFDINKNSFSGPIPVSIGRLSSLKWFDLSHNKFNGTIPESSGQLTKLEGLFVNNNTLEGVVSDVNFANLTRLRYLYAGGNSLTLKASENWVPPFQVEELNLDSWLLGPQFPLWLPSQRKLTVLSIANTGISDSIPTFFLPIFSKLVHANLSHNQIYGEIPSLPNVGDPYSVSLIDLSSNRLNGSLPLVPSNLEWLDLSNNSFSGSIYHVLCGKGEEPNKVLYFLNLGNNLLSESIPDCWKQWPMLRFIKLENNSLVGGIPSSMGHLQGLESLHLRHNNLSGELPQTLQNCSSLSIIDLSENRFTGSIPPWMGNALLQLVVLNLHSNNFWGDLPYELCCLSSLQILDIAFNNISGHVPRCLANFSAMAEIKDSSIVGKFHHTRDAGFTESNFQDNAFLVTKGRDVEYSTTLELVKSIDLSENKLFGEIPEELTKLVRLWSLNLSGNHLTGRIPRNIGDMRQLESVDFSRNQLSGVIPSSMASLTFLSHLNLSYNNLTGTIPSSTQLQSMNESSFLGNKLCGQPLPSCKPNKTITPNVVPRESEEEGDGFSEALFFASVALGFAVGFWLVLGPLLFKRSWRIAYFKVIEDIWNKVCDFSFECRYMFRKRE